MQQLSPSKLPVLLALVDSGDSPVSRIGHMVGIGAAHNWLSTDGLAPYSYDIKH